MNRYEIRGLGVTYSVVDKTTNKVHFTTEDIVAAQREKLRLEKIAGLEARRGSR